MSRSGYSDDCDDNSCWLWMGAVARAIGGKRGQALLRELKAALEAMPVKRLIGSELQMETGEVCALGALARQRGISVAGIDPEDRELIAKTFGIAEALAAEIMFNNDEQCCGDTPEQRWEWMHRWVSQQIEEAA